MDREPESRIDLLGGRLSIDPLELITRSHATQDDVVVLSGTLFEGFGNLYSDIDLYVISKHLPTYEEALPSVLVIRDDGCVRRSIEILKDCANIPLDVQYYTFHELETLARSLRTLHGESKQSTGIYRKTLHPEDEDLIHKLLTGDVLQDGTGAFNARGTFDPGMFGFLKYRNEAGGYAEFRDLIGSFTAGDLQTCLYNTRSYLIAQVSAMMFLAGSTNPRPKWFMRRLTSLGMEYSPLVKGVISWLESARHDMQQKCEAFESACELIDLAYGHSRTLLDTHPNGFSVQEALELTEHEFSARSSNDRDVLAELQLRRCMFSHSGIPLITQVPDSSVQLCAGNMAVAQDTADAGA